MSHEFPRYVIFVDQDDEEGVMLAAPLEDGDRDYFVNGILPTLRPLSDEEYMHGPVYILHTLAKSSYILYQGDVYWCVEWEPGRIVVRFSPTGALAWTALRSPNPEFAGRTPNEADIRYYKEDAENHQYNLVFNAWDAQFEEIERTWKSFTRATDETVQAFDAAMAHVQRLGEQMEARYPNQEAIAQWREQSRQNLQQWAGEGVRILPR